MMYKSLPKLQFSLLKALSLLNPSNSYEYMRYRDAWIRDKLQNSNKYDVLLQLYVHVTA